MSLNQVVATFFSWILSVIHSLVFLGFAYLLYQSFKNREFLSAIGIAPEYSFIILLGFLVGYIFIAGFVSTIVSIYEILKERK